MARPQKEGMDYFPHDTDAVNDEKIEALRALYGNDGYAFYFILLERIYRTNNFELDVSNAETIQILARKVAVTTEKFKQMLDTALKWNCFDADAYRERSCLTSSGIKKRARVVVEKRKKMQKAYRRQKAGVSEAETGEETGQETGAETPQSKEKKSKAKKSKVEESKASNNKNNMPPEGGGAGKKQAQAGEKRKETPNSGGNSLNSGKNGDSRLANDCRNDCQYDNKTENDITGGKAPDNGHRVGNEPDNSQYYNLLALVISALAGSCDNNPGNGYQYCNTLDSGARANNTLESRIRDGNASVNGKQGGSAPGNGIIGDVLLVNSNQGGNTPGNGNKGDNIPGYRNKEDNAPGNGRKSASVPAGGNQGCSAPGSGFKALENGNQYGNVPVDENWDDNTLENSIRDGNAFVIGKEGEKILGNGNQYGNALDSGSRGDNTPINGNQGGNASGNGKKDGNIAGNGKKDDRPRLIMDYYNQVFTGLWARPLRLTRERRAKIKARLRTFSADELMTAINNIRQSAFHCGENDKGRVYATPEFIFRNDSQVDKWLKVVPRHPKRAGPEPKSWGVLRQMWEEGGELN